MLLQQNLHTHTHLSNCGGGDSTVANTVREAEEVGLRLVGISDHIDTVNSGRTPLLMANYEARARLNTDITVLIGTEVSMTTPTIPSACKEERDRFDYWIAACCHYHLKGHVENPEDRSAKGFAEHFLATVEGAIKSGANIIAHPFTLPKVRDIEKDENLSMYDRARLREVVALAAEARCAFDLNPGHVRGFPAFFKELVEMARQEGAPFSQGSDGHHPGQMNYGGHEGVAESSALLESIGLTEDQLITVEELTSRGFAKAA